VELRADGLLLAAAWLLVAWVVLVRLPEIPGFSWSICLVGLFIVAVSALYYTPRCVAGCPTST